MTKHPLLPILAAVLAAACSPVVPKPVPLAVVRDDSARTATNDYRIGTGDELEVKLFYSPDLNQSVAVRPDGKISLPLLGDVAAQGETPASLSKAIEEAYGARLKRPQTVVNVKSFATQRIFVGGEVWRPGVQQLAGPLSVAQAVLAAEGPRDTARMDEVVVVRRLPDNQRQVFVVNMRDIINGTDSGQDVMLQPFDMVVVPRSDVADLDLWVDQYIRRVLPFYTSANVGYEFKR